MAGAVAAVGLVLLVPTFNALNASYVENVPPPPWIPTPSTPPNITPPTNFKPPTDMTPPTNWDLDNLPPQCPPPVLRPLEETFQNYTLSPGASGSVTWRAGFSFVVPNGTIALGGYVNFTEWQAQRVRAIVQPPDGARAWTNESAPQNGLFAQRVAKTSFEFNSYERNNAQAAKPGEYRVTLEADIPIDGRAQTQFAVLLACGGLMS